MARSRVRKVRSELKNTAYEIFIGILSILSIVNLVLVFVLRSDEDLQHILSAMNALFSVIFLGDFIYRITTAPSASGYFLRGFGWADLLASLPFPQLKILRIFRLLRVVRLMQELGPRTIWRTLIHDRANSALMTLLLLGVFVLQFGSLAILAVEDRSEDANITSASDALWYTIVTISTVGYGDQYPVTNLGRTLGGVVIIVGVGIFGTFTGYLANLFLGPQRDSGDEASGEEMNGSETVDASTHSASDAGAGAGAGTGASSGATGAAAAKGVAAGAASGAVTAGAAAASDAAAPDSADTAGAASPAELTARLEALLARSEETSAELRRLLADAAPGAEN